MINNNDLINSGGSGGGGILPDHEIFWNMPKTKKFTFLLMFPDQ